MSPTGFTVTCSVSGVVPLAGLTRSQFAPGGVDDAADTCADTFRICATTVISEACTAGESVREVKVTGFGLAELSASCGRPYTTIETGTLVDLPSANVMVMRVL